MISQSVKIDVVVENNKDGTYSVRLLRSSTVFINGVAQNTSQPTEFGRKSFNTEQAAMADAARVAAHFGASFTYP